MAKQDKQPDFKSTLWTLLGKTLANHQQDEVRRIKVGTIPECLLITDENGTNYTVSITLKKNEIDYDLEHIKETYAPDNLFEIDTTEVESTEE